MAQAFKIPRGGTYPPLNGMIPQWWDVAATSGNPGRALDDYIRQYNLTESDNENRFFDPRWANSFKKTFSSGGGSEVDFRALCFNHPGRATTPPTVAGRYLYLSWHMKVHPASSYQSCYIDVGFRPKVGSASGQASRCRITLDANTDSPSTDDGLNLAGGGFSAAYFTNPTGTAGGWGPAGTPSFIDNFTKVWSAVGAGYHAWAVHMRVPITSAADHLDLTGTFGLGFYLEADFGNGVIDYRWPLGLATSISASDPSSYQAFFLEVDALSAGDTALNTGVSLAEDHIGTQGVTAKFPASGGGTVTVSNPQVFTYNAGSTNTLWARPRNEDTVSTVPAGDIKARFKLANFGSVPMTSDPQSWTAIGGGMKTNHPLLTTGGGEGDITEIWTPTTTEATFYAAHPHQCIMATLFSANTSITFLNDSAARNMDFGSTSRFSREATISVRGLNDGYSLARRDVYIYVERKNVPVVIDDETRRKYQQVQETLRAVSSVDGEFPAAQRYVSIIRGDLRHLRLIDFDAFLAWLREGVRKEEIILNGAVFQILRALGVEGRSLAELIDRYGAQARDAFKQLQYDDNGQPQFTTTQRQIIDALLANVSYSGPVPEAAQPLPPMDELRKIMPAVRYHVYHDTGRIDTRGGVNRPVLSTQPSFGYFLWLDHDVDSWELRLQGAEKLAEDLYLIRPPTEGSVTVTTSIHAVQKGEQTEPPEKIVPFPKYPREPETGGTGSDGGCLKFLGPLGKIFKK